MGIPSSKCLPINCCLARHWSVYSFPSSRLRNCDVVPIRCAIMRCIRVHEFLPFKRWLWVHDFLLMRVGWDEQSQFDKRAAMLLLAVWLVDLCIKDHQRIIRTDVAEVPSCNKPLQERSRHKGWKGALNRWSISNIGLQLVSMTRIIQIHTAYFNCNVYN